MNEQQAREILHDAVQEENNKLFDLGAYLHWYPNDDRVTLDGDFTADKLEAVVWWMRNKTKWLNGRGVYEKEKPNDLPNKAPTF